MRQAARAAWTKLIHKLYGVDPFVCPRCGAEMRVTAPAPKAVYFRNVHAWPAEEVVLDG